MLARVGERDQVLERVRRLGTRRGRATSNLLDDLLEQARTSRLDLPARIAAADVAASDHWMHWCRWLLWLEDPMRADFHAAEMADEVLRTCVACSDIRLELIG